MQMPKEVRWMLSRRAGMGPFFLPIKELRGRKETLPGVSGSPGRAIV